MKPIEELAKQCGVKLMPLSSKGGAVDNVKRNNEALRQAIIKDFVGGLEPLYYDEGYKEPVYSLEGWK